MLSLGYWVLIVMMPGSSADMLRSVCKVTVVMGSWTWIESSPTVALLQGVATSVHEVVVVAFLKEVTDTFKVAF